jgi:hypothetical protein
MPLQNRVTPLGELVAHPARGLVYGNRGCLHDDEGRIRRRYGVRRWISCRLAFRGWHREPLLQPGKFTELFFLDEATAFAAGHRPCALCRREDYVRFGERWCALHPGDGRADEIDLVLHGERLTPGRARRTYAAPYAELPDGAFVLRAGVPWIAVGRDVLRWTPAGYVERAPRPAGRAEVLTPVSLVHVLAAGWSGAVPFLHRSARD